MPQFREWNRAVIGWAKHALGQAEEGIADVTRAVAGMRAIGSQVALGYYGGILADMLLRSGDPGRALDLAADMLDLVRRTGEEIQVPELLRVSAGALAALGRADEALAAARESVHVAERQQSLLHELRALLMLARQRRGARDLDEVLRDLYAALSEIRGGLSTRDVIEVRTTLEMV
jgi:predicted ATPase